MLCALNVSCMPYVHVLMERRDTINQVTAIYVIVLYTSTQEPIYFMNLVRYIVQ
jgi:hypothetical protein